MNKEDMGDRPSRSILKGDNTLPLLQSTNRLNRRVSFHPEVTLHKINFVPVQVDKRRETIAFIPLLRDSSDSGNSSIDSGSHSTTSEDNQDGREEETKDAIRESNNGPISGDDLEGESDEELADFESNIENAEEETMELTGQFNLKFQSTTRDNDVKQIDNGSKAMSNDADRTEKHDDNEPRESNGHVYDNIADGIDPPQYYQDDDEGDMELTSNIGLNLQNIVNTITSRVDDSIQQNVEMTELQNEQLGMVNGVSPMENDNESTQEPNKPVHQESTVNSTHTSYNRYADYSVKVNDDENHHNHHQDDDLEETMDITKFYSHTNKQISSGNCEQDHINQEITMDMTKIYDQNDRRGLIHKIQNAESNDQYNDLKLPENESIMEFTQELGKINISGKDKDYQLTRIRPQIIENGNENIEQVPENNMTSIEQLVETGSDKITDITDHERTEFQTNEENDNNQDEVFEGNNKAEDELMKQDYQNGDDNSAKETYIDPSEHIHEIDMKNAHSNGNSADVTIPDAENDNQDTVNTELTQIGQELKSGISAKRDINNEVDEPSQRMQLTQEYGEIKQVQSKRTKDETEPMRYKYPKIDNHSGINKTITTTIPLADMSTESMDNDAEQVDNYTPVSLNDFLKDISIRFYDDLEIGIKYVDRISISLPQINEEEDFKFDEFVTAMNKIPLLELYDFSCKELTKNIKDGTVLFDQFNQFTMENNPRLFKQYYLSSPNEKLAMKSEFQLIKDFTRHQAKEVWYGWRTQLIKNLITQLDDKYQSLIQDKRLLLKNLVIIDGIHEQLKSKFDNLSNQLNQLLQIETHCNILDSSDLFTLKNDLSTTCKRFKDNQQHQSLQNEELNKLNSIISDNKVLINAFNDEINDVEKSLSNNKTYELSEIELLKLKFKFLQSLTKLNYKTMEGNKINFNFVGVDIAMDFTDVHDLSNVRYSVNQKSFVPFNNSFIGTNIAPKLFNLIPGTTIVEHFQNFKKSWLVLQAIDEDIYSISWKLPIVFIDSENDNTINFKIRYFCGKHNFKIELFVSIDMSNLLDYPNNLQIRGQLIRSKTPISQKLILSNLFNDCVHNALISRANNIVIDGL